jgi:hypothetical protein
MITTTLESVMRVVMEGPTKDFDFILMDAIVLWKNATKFWYLVINLANFLTWVVVESLEEGENFEL